MRPFYYVPFHYLGRVGFHTTSASMHKGRPHFPALGRVEAAFVKKL